MKKQFFFALISLYAVTAFTASGEKSSSGKSSDKDTAVVVKDEKADNAKDKKAIKKASPQARQNAKEEEDKTKAQSGKSETTSESTSK